jgi:hypothetical protein
MSSFRGRYQNFVDSEEFTGVVLAVPCKFHKPKKKFLKAYLDMRILGTINIFVHRDKFHMKPIFILPKIRIFIRKPKKRV